jgi:hypothetical protein
MKISYLKKNEWLELKEEQYQFYTFVEDFYFGHVVSKFPVEIINYTLNMIKPTHI